MLTRLFRQFPPVGAARHELLAAQLREAEARVAQLKQSLEEARGHARDWKGKSEAAQARAAAAQADADRAVQQLAGLKDDMARQQARDEKRARDQAELRARLVAAEQELQSAREHLMMVDVKLDILEGAATALDARTRDADTARVKGT